MKISRDSLTIQTHNAVSVAGTNGTSDSPWQSCQGYDKIGITAQNDAATSWSIEVHWSHDGSNLRGLETAVAASTSNSKKAVVDVAAAYFRVRLVNADAAAHTMSAWAYLKT